jgi:hypothetical protein
MTLSDRDDLKYKSLNFPAFPAFPALKATAYELYSAAKGTSIN